MIQTIRKAWGIPELRKKIIFTLLILLIFRIGNAITVPYINKDALQIQLASMGSTYFGLLNTMSGGAFSMATVFALSIQPYINASIIIQRLWSGWQRMAARRDGRRFSPSLAIQPLGLPCCRPLAII